MSEEQQEQQEPEDEQQQEGDEQQGGGEQQEGDEQQGGEQGQPSIAAIWYERALRSPGLDAESTLALRYDLGVAQESANDLDAALKSFSQVYAVNIDYRDVADRIAALQKTTR